MLTNALRDKLRDLERAMDAVPPQLALNWLRLILDESPNFKPDMLTEFGDLVGRDAHLKARDK